MCETCERFYRRERLQQEAKPQSYNHGDQCRDQSSNLCVFEKREKVMMSEEEGHGSIKEQLVKKGYYHKSTWRQSTVYSRTDALS